jgi:hypothetical protein
MNSTAFRRRSGLRSFPCNVLKDLLVQTQLGHQTFALAVFLL